ncbi:RNA methyltransferase [Undibacterium jejuense]|uniref:tRNA (cytidine/uridine-2'-O-)-methyltransferase TrmJ n=1 Tax=Undibacterium jejuense TaxID=1344949 RepID=A0A923KI94_9BURK|nr:RNA methyltransferase [Undibacterium jejuense]MBC3862287.1 RNA methyltransferase [Undibacterium jejuense]
MNLTETDTSLFQRLRFVLVETSHPGNIGAAARAIKTMGFGQLILVNPRFGDALTHPDAIAFASGALDVLEKAKIVTSIEDALSGCKFVAAVSARLREFSPPIFTPRAVAERISPAQEGEVALVFGSERYGLPNQIVMNCQGLINIPANPDYSSLNLAQAIQLLAYECRLATETETRSNVGFHGQAASIEEVEGMYEHLEQALVAIDFLDPKSPKKLMPRLKRLFSRAQLEVEEVNILRGISKKILDFRKK